MANRFCTKCGREVVAGMRFCEGCGQALPVTASTVVECVTAATVFEQPLSAPAPVKLLETAAREPAPRVASHAPTVILDSSFTQPFSPEPASASQWQPVKETAPLWTDSSTAIPASAPRAEPRDQSTTKIVLLAVGIAAAVLAAAGGGWAWYVHAHKGVSSGAGPVAQVSQPTPQPTVQEQASAVPETTEQAPKPPAGVPVPAAPQTQQTPASHAHSVPIQPQSSSQSGQGNPAEPTPAFYPTPASPAQLPAQNTQGRSGVRHYEGPPIPHGGTVVFDNLPKERLKFTFDHTLWQLTIKPNPDGTKKIKMISLAPGLQSSCDLGWEIVE